MNKQAAIIAIAAGVAGLGIGTGVTHLMQDAPQSTELSGLHAQLGQAVRDQGYDCDRVLGQDKAVIVCRDGIYGIKVYRATGSRDPEKRLERIE